VQQYVEEAHAHSGTHVRRDIIDLQRFARGGHLSADREAITDIPPDPASLPLLQRALEAVKDFVVDVQRGYRGIWVSCVCGVCLCVCLCVCGVCLCVCLLHTVWR
jgi:hypothetical protein